MWLLITGNPVDGFTYYGPYNSSEVAADAGEQIGADWWIIKPIAPEGDKVTATDHGEIIDVLRAATACINEGQNLDAIRRINAAIKMLEEHE